MERIELLRRKADLDGTAYFEFQPGRYSGDHWTPESVFMAEDIFCLIEPIIRRHHPGFDHYTFSTIRASTWEGIIADLETLASTARRAKSIADLRSAGVGFHRLGLDAEFEADLEGNAAALGHVTTELVRWLRETLEKHERVSVLGL